MAIAVGWSDADWLVGVGEVRRDGLGDVADRANLDDGRLGLLENEFFVYGADLGLLLESLLATEAVLFGGSQGNVVFEMANAGGICGVNDERMVRGVEIDVLALGVDLVLAMVLVPLGDSGVLVHVFDDLAPADSGVVRAEADFALLRAVGDDAHLGAAEIIVEEILEPHAGDEEEVPGILRATLNGVFVSALRRTLPVLVASALGEGPGLVELPEEIPELKTLGTFERLVALEESHGHHEVGEVLAASGVGDSSDVLGKLLSIKEARNGSPFLGFLVDHDGCAHAAVGVATARERTPLRCVALDHVGEASKSADERDREPVAVRVNAANLLADVLSEVGEGIALAKAAFRSDVFIAAGERNGLEADQ